MRPCALCLIGREGIGEIGNRNTDSSCFDASGPMLQQRRPLFTDFLIPQFLSDCEESSAWRFTSELLRDVRVPLLIFIVIVHSGRWSKLSNQLQPEEIRCAVPEGRRRVAPGLNQGAETETDFSPVGAAAPYANAPSPLVCVQRP